MLYNYINIALRNLAKGKLHTFINVFGLAMGIASVFLITLYIRGELSYEKFHQEPENLYRITWEDENPQTRTPHPMAQALANDFPEVASAVSFTPIWASGLTRETHSFRNPEKDTWYDEINILAVDTTFFDVFSFPILKGNPKIALKKLNGVMISESMAKKYFGNADPMGKQLVVDKDNQLVEVTGVFKDVPVNSHFHFDFLVSYLREKSFDPEDEFYSWKDFGHYNYVRLKPGSDAKRLEAQLGQWSKKYFDWSEEYHTKLAAGNYGFKLQPVTDIHLKSKLRWELEANGNIEYVYILGAAGLLILVIACVNFMNLTTAKSAERAKEIGVRKTLGALRKQLSLQFLSESVTIALIAIIISILIVEISLPYFSFITGLSFDINYSEYLFFLVLLGIFIGIGSGIYPALYLSSIKPHLILKGKLMQSPKGSGLRKGLIVVQFSISMILISSSVIIFSQLSFLKDKNLGFSQEEVIVVPIKNADGIADYETFRNELSKINGVVNVSGTSNIPGRQFNQNSISAVQHPQDMIASSEAFVDYDFFNTLNIQLQEGRLFSKDFQSDSLRAFIINQKAAEQLYFGNSAVGKEIVWHAGGEDVRGTVIGVIKDFHFQSLHEPIRPLMLALSEESSNYILIKVNTGNFEERITSIQNTFKQFDPNHTFEFSFLQDHLNQQYAQEERTANILGTFSFIAIMIACFGLFGMSMLTFHQKVKEVSVRKVLGASPFSLLILLLGNFTRLIIIAIIIATPLAWYIMNQWLTNFSYQVTIDPVVFVGSGLVLIIISWITLSYFTYRASKLNPAETLKNE
jgi:putative ABC transport system permease protein